MHHLKQPLKELQDWLEKHENVLDIDQTAPVENAIASMQSEIELFEEGPERTHHDEAKFEFNHSRGLS